MHSRSTAGIRRDAPSGGRLGRSRTPNSKGKTKGESKENQSCSGDKYSTKELPGEKTRTKKKPKHKLPEEYPPMFDSIVREQGEFTP